MKEIRKLPASAGAQWLLDTFSLYRRAPLQLARIGLTWMLVSWVVTLLSTLIPGAAGLAVQLMTLAISPIMFGGMLYAVGEIDEGRPGLATHLLQPIRDHRVSHLLVPLAIQVLAVLMLGVLLYLMIGREGFAAFSEVMKRMEEIGQSGQQISPDDAAALVANLPAKRIALWMLLVFVTAIALTLAMFTQPALVVFDRQSGMHALRLSLQGCVENLGAMVVFALLSVIALFCGYIAFVIVIQLAMLIGGPLAAAFIAQLVLTTVLMPLYVGAVYAAWKQMFVHRGSRAAPPIPATPPANDVFHA
ncbi:BPSS1780 family membrane protein [Stenotrophomonas sp.]|uniref:BPSS1780 family membrane protein n=1 Tax=Stenotrophomonas sp. TaxID=69392 RepID=UPI00289ABC8B|nr:BPSS1780 family membrane protein [Stenotrophomonas sp.]